MDDLTAAWTFLSLELASFVLIVVTFDNVYGILFCSSEYYHTRKILPTFTAKC